MEENSFREGIFNLLFMLLRFCCGQRTLVLADTGEPPARKPAPDEQNEFIKLKFHFFSIHYTNFILPNPYHQRKSVIYFKLPANREPVINKIGCFV